MSRYCGNCGCEIKDNEKFCSNCGTPVPRINDNAAVNNSIPPVVTPVPHVLNNPASQVYNNPVPQVYNDPVPPAAPKSKNHGLTVVTIILAAVLLVESGVACFLYPGFFVEKKPLNDGISVTSEPSVDSVTVDRPGTASNEQDQDMSSAPAEYYDFSIAITEEDVSNAVRNEAAVSPESHVCSAGKITADFMDWNLDGADKLETRELGTFTDESTGTSLEVYDLSLESGKSTFFTSVDITLPRPQDGSGDGVVYYNPETDSWEPIAFDISEDGSSYIVHTPHFSRFAVIREYWRSVTPGAGDLEGIFYTHDSDPDNKTGFDIIKRPVNVSSEAIIQSLQEKLSAEDLVGASGAYSFIDEKSSIGYAVDELVGLKGFADNVDTSVSIGDLGTTVISLAAEKKVENLSKSFSALGNCVLAARIGYAIGRGENPQDILKEYSFDIVSAGISAGVEALGVSNPVGVSVTVLLAATSYFYGDDIKGWISDQMDDSVYSDPTMRCFNEFLQTQMYYTDDLGVRHPLKLDGTGWSDYLKKNIEGVDVTEKMKILTQCFDDYLNEYWNQDEIRANYIDSFNYRLYQYYRLKEFGTGQEMITKNYAKYEITDEEKQKIITNSKKRLFRSNKDLIERIYNDFLNELTNEMTKTIKADLLPYLNTEMTFVVQDTSLKEGETFDKSIYAKKILEEADKTVATLTTTKPAVDILSIDPSLSLETGTADGTITITDDTVLKDAAQTSLKLKNSLYKVGSFDGVATSIGVPPDFKLDEFYPRVNKGSNVVLECRVYYYLKFGRPKTMNLRGDSDTGAQPLSAVPIKFSKNGSGITAAVIIDGSADKSGYRGYVNENMKITCAAEALQKALDGVMISNLSSGSFSVSGSASVSSDVSEGRKYNATITLTGTQNKETGEYHVKLSGTVHESYSSSKSWTEDFGDWSSNHTSSVSSSLQYDYSGEGDTFFTNGAQAFSVTCELLEHETGYIKSIETFSNSYGNSGKTDNSGPVDLKHVVYLTASFKKVG